MSPALIPLLVDGARAVLERVLPDPEQRARAERELRKLEAEGSFAERADLALKLAQASTNTAEAATDTFRGGWRPFVGWVCGCALAYQYLVRPIAAWAVLASGHALPELPGLDANLWELLAGMLGLGTLRTFEKVKGRP